MSDGDDDGDGGSGCSSYSLKLHAPSGQEIDNEFGDDISMEDVSYDDHHDHRDEELSKMVERRLMEEQEVGARNGNNVFILDEATAILEAMEKVNQ